MDTVWCIVNDRLWRRCNVILIANEHALEPIRESIAILVGDNVHLTETVVIANVSIQVPLRVPYIGRDTGIVIEADTVVIFIALAVMAIIGVGSLSESCAA